MNAYIIFLLARTGYINAFSKGFHSLWKTYLFPVMTDHNVSIDLTFQFKISQEIWILSSFGRKVYSEIASLQY